MLIFFGNARPAKSVQRSSDPKLGNQMFLKISRGKRSDFELNVRNMWRKKAKEAINNVLDEDLELEK